MKRTCNYSVSLFVAFCLIISCTNNPKAKQEAKKMNKLSLDTKAKNTFKNTTVVFTGAMLIAFSKVFKDQTDAFADAFLSELTDGDIKSLDEQIVGLGEEVNQPLDEMIMHMDQVFDEMAKENISIYKKMFLHDLMKEGVAITEKYELPNGFRPLSQNLTREEIKRYVVKVSIDAQNKEDPIMKTYIELFEWFQKVGQEFNTDPEIQTFMQSMQK